MKKKKEYSENEDAFVHYSVIDLDGYKILSEGDLVHYELFRTDKGLQAKNVCTMNNKKLLY